jgi:hypothetical protein
MYQIDNPTSVGGLFTDGQAAGVDGTIVPAQFMNTMMLELLNILSAAGVTPDKNNNAQIVAALAVLSGGRAGLRNLLINGSFEVSQRKGLGGSYSVAGAAGEVYTVDRWFYQSDGTTGGTGAATLQQTAFTAGQTAVPGLPVYYCHIVQTASSTAGAPRFGQRIEDVSRYSGSPVTVSFYAKATAPITVNLEVAQKFGSGGSSPVALTQVPCAIGTGWLKYTATFTPASVAGKTIGPGSNLQVQLILPNGVTFALDVATFQVEDGSTGTPFERRAPGLELALAQRYYEGSAPDTIAAGTAGLAGAIVVTSFDQRAIKATFKVRKRTVPAITFWSGGGPSPNVAGQVSWDNSGTPAGTNQAVTGILSTTENSTGYPLLGAPVNGPFMCFQAQWAADAEL